MDIRVCLGQAKDGRTVETAYRKPGLNGSFTITMYINVSTGACDASPDFRRLRAGHAEVDSERNHLLCSARLQANSVTAATHFTI